MKSSGSMATTVLATIVALLAVVATTAAARPSGTSTIRLPSSGGAAGGSRPWECCDLVVRDPYFRPPKWQCNDVVAECSANCLQCEESPGGDGYVCRDWIFSLLEPPVCTPRPWDCCDIAVCTRSYPPTCWCADTVESCSSNCKECELVESSDPPVYRCADRFNGFPGPKCTPWISKKGN